MNIQKVLTSQINPAPYNPRIALQPGDPEYQKLQSSIDEFGYVEPLVWNKRTKTLISGHQRFTILKERGYLEIEVSVVDLSLEKEKALNIALNKIQGRWDEEKLAALLQELQKAPDIGVELTGFDIPEISSLIDSTSKSKEEESFDFDQALDQINNPITKTGDLIILGNHRILCGDSSSKDDIQKLFSHYKADLLFTDPPYNVNYYGGDRPHGKSRPKDVKHWQRIYADNMSQGEYEKWLESIFIHIDGFMESGAAAYIWNGHRQFGPMYQALSKLKYHIACVITWAKPTFAISYGDYNQQTEFCLYGWKENKGKHSWYGPNNESTLWEVKRDSASAYIHPTQKPIDLAQRALRNSSKQNDIVVDLFLGSGSTLIAAESMQRRCFGIEIDPRYCDAIVRRYISYAGKDNVSEDIRRRYVSE